MPTDPNQWVRLARNIDGRPTLRDPTRATRISVMLWTGGAYDILEPIPAPAPEPSAPPTGVPVCKAWCGLTRTHAKVPASHWQRLGDDSRTAYCSADCADACRPLNPPPSDPVTVAADPVPDDDDDVPTAEECAETVKRLGIDVPAWAADIRKRVAAVATGGVPAGYRLGAGWVVDRTYLCSCTGCRPNTSTEYYKPRSCGKGACAAHAVLMGALVPIDTARSVPPGPVPVEAWLPLNSGEWIVLRGYGSAGWRTVGPRRESQEEAQLDAEHGSMRGSPLDTGTATDTSWEAQADAIKAAVDKERERCLAIWTDGLASRDVTFVGDRIRSGEDAPGAVGK